MERKDLAFSRSLGTLLHISSLPSLYGIGNFGKAAYEWVDFLQDAKQSYWQILPLNPTGKGDSPYQSFSAFAGNPYFIDFDILRDEGLLERGEYADMKWGRVETLVDFKRVYKYREAVLRKAYVRFADDAAIDEFIASNEWMEQYGLFLIIKKAQRHKPWMQWSEALRARDADALRKIKANYAADLRYHAFVQYQFKRQWDALHAYANEKGIEIIGDIPIYVSLDSADVWSNPELYQLGADGYPLEVSGCPPDSFAKDGQLWGNPLYDWDYLAKTGYLWWLRRLRSSFALYDVLRLDHFRGLESYFAIPYGAKSAAGGSWRPGPGRDFIDAVKAEMPEARIIAEDLGYLTDEVRGLLEYSGYPGMKIIQYAFDAREAGDYVPYKYGANSIAYTGTHDNDTIRGWSRNAPPECIRDTMEYIGISHRRDVPNSMIRLTLQTGSNLAVIPMQDWLGLGGETRMNTPSTVGGRNWRWRMRAADMEPKLSESIAAMAAIYGRGAGAGRTGGDDEDTGRSSGAGRSDDDNGDSDSGDDTTRSSGAGRSDDDNSDSGSGDDTTRSSGAGRSDDENIVEMGE
ncbi:MAG: 4-alpha-glucanotransferase [Oscillospiraceae bacterium]|nr:4-alpha-glucanotransferase [Oscillospiraceae bacterium]